MRFTQTKWRGGSGKGWGVSGKRAAGGSVPAVRGRRSSQQKKGSVGAKSLFSFLFLLFLSPRWHCEEKKKKKLRKPEAPRWALGPDDRCWHSYRAALSSSRCSGNNRQEGSDRRQHQRRRRREEKRSSVKDVRGKDEAELFFSRGKAKKKQKQYKQQRRLFRVKMKMKWNVKCCPVGIIMEHLCWCKHGCSIYYNACKLVFLS